MMNIEIRHAEKKDVPAIKSIYQQQHAFSDTLQLPYPSEALWEKRAEQWGENHYSLVAVFEQQVIGQIGLTTNNRPRIKHIAEFGMGVDEAFLNQGVGSALLAAVVDMCDDWLNIERIQLQVHVDNTAAIALYQKFGFVEEGRHLNASFKKGQYVDVLSMARIKSKL